MIYYTGDIHGSAKGIVAFAQHYELTESDIIVILGDVGANYYGNRRDRYCKDTLAKIKPTVFCIHGNHERRPDTLAGYKQKEWNGDLVWYEDEYPNLLFARDGDIFTMEGTRHLVIGGAWTNTTDWKTICCGLLMSSPRQKSKHMWKIKSRKTELTLFSLIPAPISTNRGMRFYP
jgi:predicted phosphodiesterase